MKTKAYIIKEGLDLLLLIPEYKKIFGKYGITKVEDDVINFTLENDSKKAVTISSDRIRLLERMSENRAKIVTLISKIL